MLYVGGDEGAIRRLLLQRGPAGEKAYVEVAMELRPVSSAALARDITREASKQTYYTIRYLVDDGLSDDAYQAYAYFRWVDDWLDSGSRTRVERLEFVRRQQMLIDRCSRGEPPVDLTPEEWLLANLMSGETDRNSGLHAYLRNMMAVMAFDAERRGRLISLRELSEYTRWLAVGVTEAMHYFIGHNCFSPCGELRYQAVTGAHIAHMLRDTLEDIQAGYYNIPREIIEAYGIRPGDVGSQAYRDWVKTAVSRARACFKAGRAYLNRLESARCRIAGFAYMYRFEIVLDSIEREDYRLRAAYPERTGFGCGLEMISRAMWMGLKFRHRDATSSPITIR